LPAVDRGAILAILGSAERAFYLIDRIDEERRSVARVLPTAEKSRTGTVLEGPGSAQVAPA
jgi:phosphate:Na+ symporter